MKSVFLTLYSLLFLPAITAQDEPVVMFRLQNIQSYWCGNMIQTVVNEFLEKQVPLTLALVGHSYVVGTTTYSLRQDTELATYLDSIAPSRYIEMASHSYQYLSYAGRTVTEIELDLNSSKRENEFVTGVYVCMCACVCMYIWG
jgi:hypothetical protein